jgi:hypothetical protein
MAQFRTRIAYSFAHSAYFLRMTFVNTHSLRCPSIFGMLFYVQVLFETLQLISHFVFHRKRYKRGWLLRTVISAGLSESCLETNSILEISAKNWIGMWFLKNNPSSLICLDKLIVTLTLTGGSKN